MCCIQHHLSATNKIPLHPQKSLMEVTTEVIFPSMSLNKEGLLYGCGYILKSHQAISRTTVAHGLSTLMASRAARYWLAEMLPLPIGSNMSKSVSTCGCVQVKTHKRWLIFHRTFLLVLWLGLGTFKQSPIAIYFRLLMIHWVLRLLWWKIRSTGLPLCLLSSPRAPERFYDVSFYNNANFIKVRRLRTGLLQEIACMYRGFLLVEAVTTPTWMRNALGSSARS